MDAPTLVLRFAAAHTFVTFAQVRLLLHRHDTDPHTILTTLAKTGMIGETARLRQDQAFAVTAAGAAEVDSRLAVPRPDPRRYWDDFAAAYLWAGAQIGAFGYDLTGVYSRREMRLADQTSQPPDPATLAALSPAVAEKLTDTKFRVDPVGEDARFHYPDIVMVGDHGRLSFELQIAPTGPGRLEAILRGYTHKPNVAAIIFLVEDPVIDQAITRAADRAGARDLTFIKRTKFQRP